MKYRNIVFNGMKATKPMTRFVARQVEKWIARQQSILFLSRFSDYHVKIDREDQEPYFSCALQVMIGSRKWTAQYSEKSIQVALLNAIKHLHCGDLFIAGLDRKKTESNLINVASERRKIAMLTYRLFNELNNLSGFNREWRPAYDVEETKDHFMLSVEMPGVAKEDIKIEAVDDHLTVTGEKRKREHSYGQFSKTFALPVGTKSDSIVADYVDGVLNIMIPKSEAIKPRQIKIGDSSSAGLFKKLLGEKSKTDTVEKVAS